MTIADLPAVVPIAKRFVSKSQAADRIEIVSLDILQEAIPDNYDIIVLKNFLQVLSSDEAVLALKNTREGLSPGGRLYIIGDILENSRLSPPDTVTFNLAFLNLYDSGQAYTQNEYRSWLAGAGFENVEILSDETITATARLG